MKDQFGNDWNKDSRDKSSSTNDTVHNDSSSRGMSDMDRKNREKVINVSGDKAYNTGEGRTTGMGRDEMHKVLVGVFETEREANNVILRLKEIGYSEDDITVLAKDKEKLERLEGDTNNMASGAAIGGTLGGIAAALPALGVLAIPGIGPILAAGPIAVILGGIVAGGVAGGLIGAFTKMGVSEEDAKNYESQLEMGKIIVLVENRDNMRDDVYSTYRENNNFNDIYPPGF